MALKIAVIYGSVRSERQGIKGARFVVEQLKKRKHDVTFIDPLEYKLPLLDKRYFEYEKGKAPETLEKLARIFAEADAFVLVTGEYNHGIPPAMKNTLDHFYGEYRRKPSAIASYSMGPFGGVRAAIQLREVAAELQMPSIPMVFAMPAVQGLFDEKGNALDKAQEERIGKFIDELEWYANALKAAREKGTQ